MLTYGQFSFTPVIVAVSQWCCAVCAPYTLRTTVALFQPVYLTAAEYGAVVMQGTKAFRNESSFLS